MSCLRRISLKTCILFALLMLFMLMLIISGCGGSGSPMANPVASAPPGNSGGGSGGSGGGGGGGGTGSGGGDSFAACGTVSNSEGRITGRIIDATTGQPISGKVAVTVDLEGGSWFNAVRVGSDGRFGSDSLIGVHNFTVAFLAINSAGVFYVPKILIPTSSCQIKQGTDIGTVALMPGTSAAITAQVTAMTAQGTPARIAERPEGIFVKANGTIWAIPWSGAFNVPDTLNLEPGPSCPASTACVQIDLPVSANPAMWGLYNGISTQFQPIGTQAEYAMTIDPRQRSDSNTQGQCSQQAEFQPPTPVPPGSTTTFGPFNFTSCQ